MVPGVPASAAKRLPTHLAHEIVLPSAWIFADIGKQVIGIAEA